MNLAVNTPKAMPIALGVLLAICLVIGRIALVLSITYGLGHVFLNYHPQGATRIWVILGGSLVLLATSATIAKDPRWFINMLVYGLCLGSLLFCAVVIRIYSDRTPHRLTTHEIQAGLLSLTVFALSFFYLRRQKQQRPARPRVPPRKSPVHLLLLPVMLLGFGAYVLAATWTACRLAGWFHPAVASFQSFPESTRSIMTILFFFGSLPPGLLLANLTVHAVPAARRFFDQEAIEREGEDFHTANHGLLKFVEYWTVPFTVAGLATAILGS